MREFVHEHSGPQKCTTKDEEDKKPSQLWRNDHEKDKKPSQLRRIMQACKRQKPVGVITHCPRCQGPIEDPVIVKKCRHVFCRECLTTAMAEDSHCPYNNGACGQHLYEGDFTSFNDTTKKEEFDIDDDSTWLDRADLMKDFHHSTKTDALRNQLKEWRRNHPNDKIVLFSQFTMMLDIVEKVIDDEDWVYTRYQGGMSMSARQQALSDFRNQAEYKIMLTSIKVSPALLSIKTI
jgi:SNF2 family DNA or RNA helicase